MPIRFANSPDIEQIRGLWDVCFKEDVRFTDWYFNNIFQCNRTLLYCVDDKICSMLQVLPCKLKINGRVYPCQYIYGACTHPSYRLLGLMKELVQFAHHIGYKNNFFGSLLIPQENELFRFYEKLGYTPFFYTRKVKIEISCPSREVRIEKLQVKDIELLIQLYMQETQNINGVVLRDKQYWIQQIDLFRKTGNEVYILKEKGKCLAYGFVSMVNHHLFIQEAFAINTELLIDFGEQVAIKNHKNSISMITLPNHSEGTYSPLGCIKKFNPKGMNSFQGYMNLMYN